MTEGFAHVRYETPAPGVARILMNRPEKRNAQGRQMIYEIDDAFERACHAEDISVIILAGAGDHFSAGHELGGNEAYTPDPDQARGLWGQFGGPGWEGDYARERELYLDITERWRNAPKPTIAQVQGAAISGGVMLVWACDLVVCSSDARFRDNTAGEMSVPGVEFFQHAFELGVRRAKEWLFTSDWLSADDAERRGMVNHVVAREELADFTLNLASRIAATDRFTLKLAKAAINQAQDLMGRRQAMEYGFALHQIGHLQNMLVHGQMIDSSRLPPSLRERLAKKREDGGRI